MTNFELVAIIIKKRAWKNGCLQDLVTCLEAGGDWTQWVDAKFLKEINL